MPFNMTYAYTVGYEEGIKAYDSYIPREKTDALPLKFEDLEQQLECIEGRLAGFDYAEQNDCTTNVIYPEYE